MRNGKKPLPELLSPSPEQDDAFPRSPRRSAGSKNGKFPPPALVEVYQEPDAVFFCGLLLACHVGRGRSPSVSEVGEKMDVPNFSR